MRKLLLILVAAVLVVPAFAQKMTKEEKAAAAKLAYEAALESINNKSWVIVPEYFTTQSGEFESNSNNDNFLSCEGADCFSQGYICCDNDKTNIATPTEYDVKVDKKGNVKIRIVVDGRFWRGIYTISMKNNGNMADVIFVPNNGNTRKFTGPIVPLAGASFNKRSNPI